MFQNGGNIFDVIVFFFWEGIGGNELDIMVVG